MLLPLPPLLPLLFLLSLPPWQCPLLLLRCAALCRCCGEAQAALTKPSPPLHPAPQLFIFYTIQQYGALHFALIMTIRQFLSIVLSCLVFSHELSAAQW